MSEPRTYTVGLPVSVTVADDGTVTYLVHTEDASEEVANAFYEADEDDDLDASQVTADAEAVGRDHDRRHGRETS